MSFIGKALFAGRTLHRKNPHPETERFPAQCKNAMKCNAGIFLDATNHTGILPERPYWLEMSFGMGFAHRIGRAKRDGICAPNRLYSVAGKNCPVIR